jgi:hypothetical protein
MVHADVSRFRSLVLILILSTIFVISPNAEARRRRNRRNNFRNRDLFQLQRLLALNQLNNAGAFSGAGGFGGSRGFAGDPFDPINAFGGNGRGFGGIGNGLNQFGGNGFNQFGGGNNFGGGFGNNNLNNALAFTQFGDGGIGGLGGHGFGNQLGNGRLGNGFGRRQINPLGFGDVSQKGATGDGVRFADTAQGKGPCGSDFYPASCSATQAAKPKLEKESANELLDSMTSYASSNGLPSNTFSEMSKRALTGNLGNLKDTYQAYFASWKKKFPDLTNLIASSKTAMKAAIDAEPFESIYDDQAAAALRKKMKKVVDEAKVIAYPDPNDPEQVAGYAKSCRNGEVDNAFADADDAAPKNIYLCLSRIQMAMKRAGGDVKVALADLDGTLKHEEAHLVFASNSDAFKGQNACYYDRLEKPAGLTKSKFDQSQLNHEIGADALAALATVKRVEEGSTFDLSPEQYLEASFARACGSQPSDNYLGGPDRARVLGETLANHEATQSLTSCSLGTASRPSCGLKGAEPRSIF